MHIHRKINNTKLRLQAINWHYYVAMKRRAEFIK